MTSLQYRRRDNHPKFEGLILRIANWDPHFGCLFRYLPDTIWWGRLDNLWLISQSLLYRVSLKKKHPNFRILRITPSYWLGGSFLRSKFWLFFFFEGPCTKDGLRASLLMSKPIFLKSPDSNKKTKKIIRMWFLFFCIFVGWFFLNIFFLLKYIYFTPFFSWK